MIETIDLWSKKLCHWDQCDRIELFQMMLNLTKLKIIYGYEFWNTTDLSFMEPELLVNVFQRLEELCLGGSFESELACKLFPFSMV